MRFNTVDYEDQEIIDCDHRCQDCQETCKNCKCNDCHDSFDEENESIEDYEAIDEFLEEKIDNFMKNLVKESKKDDFCFHCELKKLLENVYLIAQEDGVNSAYLSLSDMLQKVVED